LPQPNYSAAQSSQVDEVRSLFEDPNWYFERRAFDIRVRVEIVRELVRLSADAQMLDIGCGDGSISIPLLSEKRHLTLVDLSAKMLSLATSKIPVELSRNVKTVNQDFMKATFEPQSFDLILCIGLLAHVESPAEVIGKIVSLLKPTGTVIVEYTDSSHFTSRLVLPINRVWAAFRPFRYDLQTITFSAIKEAFERYQLSPVATFRYGAPPPGIHRFLSQKSLYLLSRWIFGTATSNRNAWMGNEHISVFASKALDDPKFSRA
jgi:ubiquinone/menaquinone biosynthesis C-methylase UbiE